LPRLVGLVLAGLALVLADCGGSTPPPQPPEAVDQDIVSGWRLARFAFEQGQYDQAAGLYARVLERAYARDDLKAIGDVGYELAVVRLRQRDVRGAAEQARRTRDELRRRGAKPFAELHLVESVALYETGDREGAEAMADEAIKLASDRNAPVVARALYLRGRIAADRGDRRAVSRVLAALGAPQDAGLRADRLELAGRLNMLENRPENALPAFRESADLRREVEDYIGMARALALAGEAAESSGQLAEAADLYFRSGRSAEVEGNPADARHWLGAAARLAATTGQAEILSQSRERLESLAEEHEP
jgi:tetratricopeptide (TPR) repeat protein